MVAVVNLGGMGACASSVVFLWGSEILCGRVANSRLFVSFCSRIYCPGSDILPLAFTSSFHHLGVSNGCDDLLLSLVHESLMRPLAIWLSIMAGWLPIFVAASGSTLHNRPFKKSLKCAMQSFFFSFQLTARLQTV